MLSRRTANLGLPRWTVDRIILGFVIAALILLFPMGHLIPAAWCQENGIVENLQVVVLGIVAVLSWVYATKARVELNKRFWSWSLPLWLVMIGRELSWGRVFFLVETASGENVMPNLGELWYGPAVNPSVALVILAMFVAVFRHKLYQVFFRLWKNRRFFWVSAAAFIIAIVLSVALEKHMFSFAFGISINEELPELLAYLCILCIVMHMGRTTMKENI